VFFYVSMLEITCAKAIIPKFFGSQKIFFVDLYTKFYIIQFWIWFTLGFGFGFGLVFDQKRNVLTKSQRDPNEIVLVLPLNFAWFRWGLVGSRDHWNGYHCLALIKLILNLYVPFFLQIEVEFSKLGRW